MSTTTTRTRSSTATRAAARRQQANAAPAGVMPDATVKRRPGRPRKADANANANGSPPSIDANGAAQAMPFKTTPVSLEATAAAAAALRWLKKQVGLPAEFGSTSYAEGRATRASLAAVIDAAIHESRAAPK